MSYPSSDHRSFTHFPRGVLSERDKHLLVLAHILKQELTVEQQNEIVLAMDSALIENPRHLKALYTKGRIFMMQGNLNEGENALRAALSLAPNSKIIKEDLETVRLSHLHPAKCKPKTMLQSMSLAVAKTTIAVTQVIQCYGISFGIGKKAAVLAVFLALGIFIYKIQKSRSS